MRRPAVEVGVEDRFVSGLLVRSVVGVKGVAGARVVLGWIGAMVAAETGGAGLLGGALDLGAVGAAVVGAVARVVVVGGSAAEGGIDGWARLPNANASMLPAAG